MFEGGCDCGAIRYRMTSDPIMVNCCHCHQCQRGSGSAFGLNAVIEADRIELIGDRKPETFIDAKAQTAERCPDCSVTLWAYHRFFGDAVRFVRAGTLDDAAAMVPDAHFFIVSKHPWVTIPEGAPAYEALPPDDAEPSLAPEAQARLDAVTPG